MTLLSDVLPTGKCRRFSRHHLELALAQLVLLPLAALLGACALIAMSIAVGLDWFVDRTKLLRPS